MDVRQRSGNGLLHGLLHGSFRLCQFLRGDKQGAAVQADLVKPGGIIKQGGVSADGNVLNNGINGISYGILGKGPAVHPAFHLFKTTVGRSINFHKIATYGKWEGSFPIFMQTVKPSVLFDFHNGNGKK